MSIEAQSNDEIQDKSVDAARRFFSTDKERELLAKLPPPLPGSHLPMQAPIPFDLLPPPQASQRVEGIAPPVEVIPQPNIREVYKSKINDAINKALIEKQTPVIDGKPLIQALQENPEFIDHPRLQQSLIEYAQLSIDFHKGDFTPVVPPSDIPYIPRHRADDQQHAA